MRDRKDIPVSVRVDEPFGEGDPLFCRPTDSTDALPAATNVPLSEKEITR
jgi:hypothetical protein